MYFRVLYTHTDVFIYDYISIQNVCYNICIPSVTIQYFTGNKKNFLQWTSHYILTRAHKNIHGRTYNTP